MAEQHDEAINIIPDLFVGMIYSCRVRQTSWAVVVSIVLNQQQLLWGVRWFACGLWIWSVVVWVIWFLSCCIRIQCMYLYFCVFSCAFSLSWVINDDTITNLIFLHICWSKKPKVQADLTDICRSDYVSMWMGLPDTKDKFDGSNISARAESIEVMWHISGSTKSGVLLVKFEWWSLQLYVNYQFVII